MKFFEVQTLLEQFIQNNWSETEIAYENVAFNPDAYTEYIKFNVLFGATAQRSATIGCYRVTGVVMIGLNVKPASGVARLTELATMLSNMLISVIVRNPDLVGTPAVNLKVPEFQKASTEIQGWVKGSVSCPFYYDLEI